MADRPRISGTPGRLCRSHRCGGAPGASPLTGPGVPEQRPADHPRSGDLLQIELDGRLVVELDELQDRETIRELAARILEPHGFRVHHIRGTSKVRGYR